MKRLFKITPWGGPYGKWYHLEERKMFFWVSHYKYYDSIKEAEADVEAVGGILLHRQ